ALAARLNRLHNATVSVKEWQGEGVFLHEVIAGAADRSYGIQVAKLAGLPAGGIQPAKVVLSTLGKENPATPKSFAERPLLAPLRARPRARRRTVHWESSSPRPIPTKCRRARRWMRSMR